MGLRSRPCWIAAACGLWCGTPSASAQDALRDAIANMRACAAERDDARRLSCYDKQFRQSAVSPSRAESPSRPESSGRPESPVEPNALSAEERFGMSAELERKEHGAPGQAAQLGKMSSRIATVSYRLRGEAVVTLDNGQVWEQSEVQPRVPLKPGDPVSIRRGALGSFWLSASGSGFRVRRVH
jgi:hypothetical protein